MRTSKIAVLFLSLLLMAAPLLSIPMTPAEANPVYYTVEPVAISPLTNINSSINGLETPATPSPIGQNFTVEIYLVGATADNVPAGVEGVEIHFYFGNILAYAVPTGFTNMLGQPGGVLTGPSSQLLSAISAGFYDASGKMVSSPPYSGAVYYNIASASMAGGWNGANGLMANVTFQIIKQPQSGNGETTVNLPLACNFTDVTDSNAVDVTHDTIQGTLTIDATPTISQQNYTLKVNTAGNGTVTENPVNATYASGSNVTLTAVPGSGWVFGSWSGDVTGTQNPVVITMNGNKTVTATFAQLQSLAYTLTVNVVGNGTVTESPVNATYSNGTVVTVTAVPSGGWTFQGWNGDLTGTQNPANITMNGNKDVTATFVSQVFAGSIDLFTQKTPFSGKGPNQSSDAFQQQEMVFLYALVEFGGDPVTNKVVAFEVDGPANSLENFTVTGAATTNSSGIAEFSFRVPTAPINGLQMVFGKWYAVATVDLDQVSLSDSLTFEVGWIVSIKSIMTLNDQLVPQTDFAKQNTVVFNLTLENIAFTPRTATITIDVEDTGGKPVMHIELDNLTIPPGESHAQGSSQIPLSAEIGEANVSATAYTAPPSSGGTAYSPSVYTAFNIVAALQYYTLTVNVVGNGTVTKSPAATTYLRGSIVTLTAVPGFNWTFSNWSGDLTGTQNPANITIDANKSVTAKFVQVVQRYYTLTVNVVGNGSVSENPSAATYLSGTVVTLTAITAANWTFQGWSGDVTGMQNPASITMNADKTVTATFTVVAPVKRAVFVSYSLLLVGFMALGGLAGSASLMMLMIAHADRRRRRKTAVKKRRYTVIVHRHI